MTLPPAYDVARQWVEKAEHDLKTAEHTLTLKENCPYDTVCFHAQQCAEKYLKALLTLRGIAVQKTHDLTELLPRAPTDTRLEAFAGEVAELNPYAIETRYPGDWEPQTREDAERAVALARRLREAIRERLPKEVL